MTTELTGMPLLRYMAVHDQHVEATIPRHEYEHRGRDYMPPVYSPVEERRDREADE